MSYIGPLNKNIANVVSQWKIQETRIVSKIPFKAMITCQTLIDISGAAIGPRMLGLGKSFSIRGK